MASSHSSMRENQKKDAPWILSWIMEDQCTETELTTRLALKAKLENIHDFDCSNDDWIIEPIPDKNWLEESYKQFPPFIVDSFFIYGSHYDGDTPDDKIGLQIDAATAFGSGEHGTTKGCLLALQELKDQGLCPWNVLDMGCGSGILAIAAWKLWKTPVLGVDIEDEAINVTARHCNANGVKIGSASLSCGQGDGFAATSVQNRKPFDLIIANILAGPLKDMAGDMKTVLDENGFVILSGMLNEQADDVLKSYEDLGLKLKQRYDLDEWSTLVLQDTAA